ncbi:MAG TPA: zf-HC2 domain-containing protein [Gemmatimonadaceae bacterium]|nr:zf-HC2 domain-containing protein [Gemmatimonadaceae bacterium]
MHCSDFLDQHCDFVDDTLAGVELVRMQRHLADCPTCASRDTRIRRSLMVARNLPSIEPSPGFSARLEDRLRTSLEPQASWSCTNFKAVASIGAVASLLMLGYVASALSKAGTQQHQDIVLQPVIAMAERPQPEIILPPLQAPAIIASVSAGMPILPAALFAEQGPLHFATYRKVH